MRTRPWKKAALAALALLMPAMLAACAPQTAEAPRGGSLAQLRAKAQRVGSVRVIARLRGGESLGPAMADLRASALQALEAQGVAVATPLSDRLALIVVEVTPEQLDAMSASRDFDYYVEDRLARPMLADSGPLVQAPDVWALGARGQGQAVAILDTGVDASHPFLAGRVTAEACFSSRSTAIGARSVCPNGETMQTGAGSARPCNADGCEHGTHVAGIAAGRGERFSGVAPDAEIIAVQVFSQFADRGRGPTPCRDSGQPSPCIASFTSDQIRGLDHVLRLAAERRVAAVNMSLGGGRSETACDSDVAKPVIDQLRAAGVVTVIASGNDGFPDAVSMPGCISTAVTVGATSKQDQLASFSNRGPQVDLLAPGVAINSSVPGGEFSAFSGTSMATPHVAGAVAVLRSLRPELSIDMIERALKTTGAAVQGRPRIALLAAAQALPPPPSDAEIAMTLAFSPELRAAIAQFQSLPGDRPVRVLARARVMEGASARVRADALSSARSAARAAGIESIESIEGQALLILEATPEQAIRLAQSGAVSEVQVDATARPQ